MKVAFNQNDIELYPLDDEFSDDCENCVFLRNITTDSYTCILPDFEEDIFEQLPGCFNSIFIPESLSNIFKL